DFTGHGCRYGMDNLCRLSDSREETQTSPALNGIVLYKIVRIWYPDDFFVRQKEIPPDTSDGNLCLI
ncbi:MAG: hypothetical protein VZR73_08950, partial [Acutalibacteraceae bacterium]|nr:hypothetical protein [Acutalibacteraceae bacterium]